MEFFCGADQIRNSELIVDFIIGIGIQNNIYRSRRSAQTGKKSRILLFFWYPLCSLFLFHTQSQLLFLFLPALFAPQIFL